MTRELAPGSIDEAADVIADLPAEKAQEILGLMEKEEAADVHELLAHEGKALLDAFKFPFRREGQQ